MHKDVDPSTADYLEKQSSLFVSGRPIGLVADHACQGCTRDVYAKKESGLTKYSCVALICSLLKRQFMCILAGYIMAC